MADHVHRSVKECLDFYDDKLVNMVLNLNRDAINATTLLLVRDEINYFLGNNVTEERKA